MTTETTKFIAATQAEAWMACYVAAMYIGGYPTPLMTYRLGFFGNVNKVFSGYIGYDRLYAAMIPMFDRTGWRELITGSVEAIPKEVRPTLYAQCMELVFSRIRIGQNETAYLTHLQAELGLDKMMCHKLHEATVIKLLLDKKEGFDAV